MYIGEPDFEMEKSVSLAERTETGLDHSVRIVPTFAESKSAQSDLGGNQMLRFVRNEDFPFGFSYAYNSSTENGIELNLYYDNDRILDETSEHINYKVKGNVNTDAKDIIEENNYVTGGNFELGNDHIVPFSKTLSEIEKDDPLVDILREMSQKNSVSVYIQHIFYPIDYGVWTNRTVLFGKKITPSKLHREYKKAINHIEEKQEKNKYNSASNLISGSSEDLTQKSLESIDNIASKKVNDSYPIRKVGGNLETKKKTFEDTAERIKDNIISENKRHYATSMRIILGSDNKTDLQETYNQIKREYDYEWGSKNKINSQQFLKINDVSNQNQLEQLAVECRQRKTAINLYGKLRNPYTFKTYNSIRRKPMIIHPNVVSQLAHIPSENINVDVDREEDTGFGDVDDDEIFTDF